MKSLPNGNYALSIAHPGHELRLHGFLEQTKPIVFMLTDGSHRTGQDMMQESIKVMDKTLKYNHGKITMADVKGDAFRKTFRFSFPQNPPGQDHVKDEQIFYEILNQRTEFFISFIDFIATNLLKYKIDFLISDASEGTDVCHEMTNIMSDIAIRLIQKKRDKKVLRYDFAISRPYDEIINDDCIHIELDDASVERKVEAILNYPLALTDLKPNIILDMNVIMELGKLQDGRGQVKHILKEIGMDFLRNEYIRPFMIKINDPEKTIKKPEYEIYGEKSVAAGKYTEVITYEKHLKPLKEKLEQLALK